MTENKATTWAEVDRLLSDSLVKLRADIDRAKVSEITEYLDHREYGLAYSVLVEAVEERRLVLDAPTAASLALAANLMGIGS